MYWYEETYDNGCFCVKVNSKKEAIQDFLNSHISGDLQPELEPFEYLSEKEVADILANKPSEENEKETARYNELKKYVDNLEEGEQNYPVCLVAYPDEDWEHTYEAWSPNEDGIIDWWESLMDYWAKWSAEYRERPHFFEAVDASDEVEDALEDDNEDKAVAIIQTVFNECEEYQAKAVVASLKLRDELEHWNCGDELSDELFDGTIQELCNFAGTDCPRIEAGDLCTEDDWGRKSVEYIGSPEEYFKEFLAENDNLKLPIVNGEVDWDNLDAETEQWGAGAWRDYVQSKENELCYDCLKTIRKAFEALNWTFGTTF